MENIKEKELRKFKPLYSHMFETPRRNGSSLRCMLKSEYSGYLRHWRRVKSRISDDLDKHGRSSLEFQFAWKQKKKPDGNYPDFNYSSDAMICNVRVVPDWSEAAGYNKEGKKIAGKVIPFKDGKRYTVSIDFDSIDDDVMYRFYVIFDSFDEAVPFAKEVMEKFSVAFREAYPTNSSIYDATYGIFKEMFESAGGKQN